LVKNSMRLLVVRKAWLLLVLGMAGISALRRSERSGELASSIAHPESFLAKSADLIAIRNLIRFIASARAKTMRTGRDFTPGPANGMAGGREHPFTILFDLHEPAGGVFHLKIAVLYETPRLSHLKVDLNGHSGMFYFHPQLDYGAGDWEGTFVPQHFCRQQNHRTCLRRWLRPEQTTGWSSPRSMSHSTVENSLGSIARLDTAGWSMMRWS